MTYRIEITADSLTELAGRVAALAVQLQTQHAPVIVNHVGKAPRKAAPVAEPVALVAEPVALVAEPVALVVEPVALVVEPVAPAAVVYDPVVDIAPRVLAYVALRGRDAMLELLSQFGVERASHVPAEHHAELVALLDAAINA